MEALCPGTPLAALLDKPNNNLAVEYCKAILELAPAMTPVPRPARAQTTGRNWPRMPSASPAPAALRKLWQTGGADAVAPYVPEAVLPFYREAFAAGQYTDFDAAGRCELALLRSRCVGQTPFAAVRGVSEGLEHRLERPCGPAPPTKSCWTP